MKRITNEEFRSRSLLVHGNNFDYSKTNLDYRDEKGRVIITCPIHGDFLQTPKNHLHGQGCPQCSHKSTKYTVEEIKEKIISKYGDKYDVSLINEYNGNKQKLPLLCNEHGYFESSWNDLDNNHGCQKCGKIRNFTALRKTKEKFVEESVEIHQDKYDYSLVEYISAHKKIILKCKKCGCVFKITPHEHLKGEGCPRCNESHLENETRIFLDKNNIGHLDRKQFSWLGRQHLDFYLPEYNIAIECQGKQHFGLVKHFGGVDGFKKCSLLDKRKKMLCEEHNIKILYFSHEKYNTFLGEKTIKTAIELLERIKEDRKKEYSPEIPGSDEEYAPNSEIGVKE